MKRGKKILICLIVVICIWCFVYINNNWIQIEKYHVCSSRIPNKFDEYKIIQLSDLHNKEFGKDNMNLIKKIYNVDPNIIVLTGDMINSTDTDFKVFYNLIEKLSKKYDIYFIKGNHEERMEIKEGELQIEFYEKIEKFGVKILNDKKQPIVIDEEKINLYGLELPLNCYSRKISSSYQGWEDFDVEDVEEKLGDINKNEYNILLSHNPLYFKVYKDWGADLTLSGHIHGGIIRMPFVGGLLSPEVSFFPKYDAG
ncbi:MAG: metallophosphoesterase, partial [Clostridiaceae bacterium]